MISVCIATYNGAATLHEQLASILPQLSAEDEIIVSDDGSTDDTKSVVEAFKSPIIRWMKGPCNGSLISNFEHALKEAKGDYIFLSDQDDVWMPNKVEEMMKVVRQGYDCVISDCHVTNQKLEIQHDSFFQLIKMHSSKWYNLLVHNFYLGCCMLFTRQVKEKALPFPPGIPMHDIWIGNIAAFFFKVYFLPQPLILFRRHDNSSSSTATRSPYSLWTQISFRLRIALPLLARRFRQHSSNSSHP